MTDIVSDGSTFDSAKYRQVLGHFPTGVTVITAMNDGVPVGMAAARTTVGFTPTRRRAASSRVDLLWRPVRSAP